MIDFRAMLRAASEPGLADFSSKLTPGKSGITGVRMPVIRRISKMMIRDGWEKYIPFEPENFEEEVLLGITIAAAPMDADRRIGLTDGFLPRIDNWATCDYFCNTWRMDPGDREKVWGYFAGLMDTGEEFPMRVSVVARMDLFDDRDHTAMLLEDIQGHDNEGYYYRMGAAWAVSVCYVRFPDITREALESGRLCDWTQNKSLQKIRESYRVSAEDKESLKGLRRRSP